VQLSTRQYTCSRCHAHLCKRPPRSRQDCFCCFFPQSQRPRPCRTLVWDTESPNGQASAFLTLALCTCMDTEPPGMTPCYGAHGQQVAACDRASLPMRNTARQVTASHWCRLRECGLPGRNHVMFCGMPSSTLKAIGFRGCAASTNRTDRRGRMVQLVRRNARTESLKKMRSIFYSFPVPVAYSIRWQPNIQYTHDSRPPPRAVARATLTQDCRAGVQGGGGIRPGPPV